jgi:chorismate mutase
MEKHARPIHRFSMKSAMIAVPPVAIALLLLSGCLHQKPAGDVSGLRSAVADRLALIPDVARHKWNTGAAITDPEREQRLIQTAIVKGRQIGIPDQVTRAAIEAQIAASKQMQEELIQSWSETGEGPFVSVPDFTEETRPKIEEATDQLIRELGAALNILNTCDSGTTLRAPPKDEIISEEVWATAAEGLIQSVGGPTKDDCSQR